MLLVSIIMLYVCGNNDTDDAEYYVNHNVCRFPLIRRGHGAYFTVLSFKKPRHDEIAELSPEIYKKITA